MSPTQQIALPFGGAQTNDFPPMNGGIWCAAILLVLAVCFIRAIQYFASLHGTLASQVCDRPYNVLGGRRLFCPRRWFFTGRRGRRPLQ